METGVGRVMETMGEMVTEKTEMTNWEKVVDLVRASFG